MPVTVKNKNKTLYFFIKGEIDHHTAPAIREAIDDGILMFETAEVIVLDFSGVTFMDSSGVGLVMGRYRNVSAHGGRLEAVNLPPWCYRIMKMSGLEKIAKIRMKGERR